MLVVRTSTWVSPLCCLGDVVCWSDWDDLTPPTKQGRMGGRARWHPGNRLHQVTDRVLGYTILTALHEVLTLWKEADEYILSDEDWHGTA